MKIQLSSRRLFTFGFVLLVATNSIVLSGVASNRSGEPESQIILTERELRLPYQNRKEDSGMALQLTWRVLNMDEKYDSFSGTTPAWFNSEKLVELGFKIDDFLNRSGDKKRDKEPIPQEVFIVLEKEGAPYREVVKRAEAALKREESLLQLHPEDKEFREKFKNAEKRLERERMSESRLFAIDAGLDPYALREKYRDRTRFIIAKGSVRPNYWNTKEREIFGHISELSVSAVHVPLEHRRTFDDIVPEDKTKGRRDFTSPRFEVKLVYGSRFEPWIASVEPVKN